jgi:hypothetical protein
LKSKWANGAAAGILAAIGVAAAGCGGAKGSGTLHARQAVLEREVEGLRQLASRLERGEAALPLEDVVVGISDGMVQDVLRAQLPLEIDVQGLHLVLDRAEVAFSGSPAVTLTGAIAMKDHPDLQGELRAIGVLENIQVDPDSGTLRAHVAIDHIDLLKMAGLETLLGGGTLDELSRTVRKQLEGHIPEIQIPVKLEQSIVLPSITDGPVRIQGASMPLDVGVSDVFAGQGVLWIGVRVQPGDFAKTPATSKPAGGPS